METSWKVGRALRLGSCLWTGAGNDSSIPAACRERREEAQGAAGAASWYRVIRTRVKGGAEPPNPDCSPAEGQREPQLVLGAGWHREPAQKQANKHGFQILAGGV